MLSRQKVKLSASGRPRCSLLQSLQVNTVSVCLSVPLLVPCGGFQIDSPPNVLPFDACHTQQLTAHLPKRHAHTYVRLSVVYCSRVFSHQSFARFFVSPYVCLNVFRVVTNVGHFRYDVRLCASMWHQGFT
jgi:hypothetical protein